MASVKLEVCSPWNVSEGDLGLLSLSSIPINVPQFGIPFQVWLLPHLFSHGGVQEEEGKNKSDFKQPTG